jgi:hypothetical protein
MARYTVPTTTDLNILQGNSVEKCSNLKRAATGARSCPQNTRYFGNTWQSKARTLGAQLRASVVAKKARAFFVGQSRENLKWVPANSGS